MRFRTRRQNELDFNRQWGDLAVYNSEVARGIVHTPEYKRKMKAKQLLYNEAYETHDRRR